jgi:hypothetical protein
MAYNLEGLTFVVNMLEGFVVIEGNTSRRFAAILPLVVCASQENMIIRLKQCSKKEVNFANRFLKCLRQLLEVYGEDTRVDRI